MEASENSIKLYYNTEVEKLQMPEYGRNVLNMIEQLKAIPEKAKRTEQAYAVVKVMESLNPQVHQQENYAQKLWDHLFIIAGYDLDVDAPFPKPVLPHDGLCRTRLQHAKSPVDLITAASNTFKEDHDYDLCWYRCCQGQA